MVPIALWDTVKQERIPVSLTSACHNPHHKSTSPSRTLGTNVPYCQSVLSRAGEKYERHYELKRRGYDLDRIAGRVAEIYGIKSREIFFRGKQQRRVKARSLFCFWAVSELGMSHRELAGLLGMSSPGVGFSVERGATIARENGYHLIE